MQEEQIEVSTKVPVNIQLNRNVYNFKAYMVDETDKKYNRRDEVRSDDVTQMDRQTFQLSLEPGFYTAEIDSARVCFEVKSDSPNMFNYRLGSDLPGLVQIPAEEGQYVFWTPEKPMSLAEWYRLNVDVAKVPVRDRQTGRVRFRDGSIEEMLKRAPGEGNSKLWGINSSNGNILLQNAYFGREWTAADLAKVPVISVAPGFYF